jgi:hypothetical protein
MEYCLIINTHNFSSLVKKTEIMAEGIRCADHATLLYPLKLALTSPTNGGRSDGTVQSGLKPRSYLITYLLCTVIDNDGLYLQTKAML